jgi:hypothetical protein
MDIKTLAPGFGGKFQKVIGYQAPDDSIMLDCSKCSSIAIQCVDEVGTPTGNLQPQESFNGTVFANLGSAIDTANSGVIAKFDCTDGPFGILRITSTVAENTSVKVTVVGFKE